MDPSAKNTGSQQLAEAQGQQLTCNF